MKKAKHKKVSQKNTNTPEKTKGKSTCCDSSATWMISTIVLAVLLVASLILGFSGAMAGKDVDLSVKLTQAGAEAKAKEFMDVLGEVERVPLNIRDVQEEHGLYKVTVDAMGQESILFMTSDGELIFFQAITLEEIQAVKSQMELAEQMNQLNQPPQTTQPATLNLENVNLLGDLNSDVIVVEYSSPTCPICKNHHDVTFPRINAEFIETNLIAYVYKHFARNEIDIVAGNAMECAGEQEKFFEYKAKIYANTQRLTEQNAYIEWAEELDLDIDSFNTCIQENRYRDRVNADTQEARVNEFTGTPSFLINDNKIIGGQPFENFKQIIDRELAS